jgi:hypothetical protein
MGRELLGVRAGAVRAAGFASGSGARGRSSPGSGARPAVELARPRRSPGGAACGRSSFPLSVAWQRWSPEGSIGEGLKGPAGFGFGMVSFGHGLWRAVSRAELGRAGAS